MSKHEPLTLLVCTSYHQEAETLLRRHSWENIVLQTYSPVCMHAQSRRQLEARARQMQTVQIPFAVVGTCPMAQQLSPDRQALSKTDPKHHLPQCFYGIANRAIVDNVTAQGSYILTPGWLSGWKQHLKSWGFDQPTARIFFQESIQKICLLDTGVGVDSEKQLAEMGAYLDLPVERVQVGLDVFDLYLTQIVEHWQLRKRQEMHAAEASEMQRSMANYAMILDLIPWLAQKHSEAEVIAQTLDIFQMLFSANTLHYLQIEDNLVLATHGDSLDPSALEPLLRWAREEDTLSCWIDGKSGFYLRFTHNQQTVGALLVSNLSFPQYIHHYLNLSIAMTSIYGLAIINARILQRLKDAEQFARHEKEISDTLCQVMSELTAHFEQDEVLRRILLSLYRVIPYSEAAVFLLNNSQLNFKIGMSKPAIPVHHLERAPIQAEMLAYEPRVRSLDIDKELFAADNPILTHIDQIPQLSQMLCQQGIGSWMGIPLISSDKLFGLLSVVSPDAASFNSHQITLAQSFANAIENAHVLREVRGQASTDPLTGLYNRRSFFDLAQKDYAQAIYTKLPLAALMMDVDHFKRVNDTYGHDIGDLVLVKLAKLCARKIRDADILGRYGGEEFVLVLPETPLTTATKIAERLRRDIAEMRIRSKKGEIQVHVSIGIASLDIACSSLEELIKRSDTALYQAKQQGRNRVIVWETPAD
jgi:diguanylate cyclase (GGDEF)-like protein